MIHTCSGKLQILGPVMNVHLSQAFLRLNIFECYMFDLQAAFQSSPVMTPSPGRSGARFFISKNRKFYVKTIESEDIERLHNILPQYHHVSCVTLFSILQAENKVRRSAVRALNSDLIETTIRVVNSLHSLWILVSQQFGPASVLKFCLYGFDHLSNSKIMSHCFVPQ